MSHIIFVEILLLVFFILYKESNYNHIICIYEIFYIRWWGLYVVDRDMMIEQVFVGKIETPKYNKKKESEIRKKIKYLPSLR